MKMTLFRDKKVRDGKGGEAVISAGTYEIERITNPLDPEYCDWFVLCGTTIGASTDFWHSCVTGYTSDNPFKVIIEE